MSAAFAHQKSTDNKTGRLNKLQMDKKQKKELYLLAARELELRSPQSLNDVLLVLGLCAHGHDHLPNVHTGHCALWLSERTTHSSLEPGQTKHHLVNHSEGKKLEEKQLYHLSVSVVPYRTQHFNSWAHTQPKIYCLQPLHTRSVLTTKLVGLISCSSGQRWSYLLLCPCVTR